MTGKLWLSRSFMIWFCVGVVFAGLMGAIALIQPTQAMAHLAAAAAVIEAQGMGHDPVFPTNADWDGLAYEQQGRMAYAQDNFSAAIEGWQQALGQYVQRQDILGQARVLSNLSLAYQKLGNWNQAQECIDDSVALLSTLDRDVARVDETARQRGLAQALNTQGSLLFDRGQTQAALVSWEEAIALYQAIMDQPYAIQAQLNRVQAMQELGYHRRALALLEQLHLQVEAIAPDSSLQLAVLRQQGDVLRLMGELEQSQQVLLEALALAQHSTTISDRPPSQSLATERAAILLSLGQTERMQDNVERSMAYYQQALAANPNPVLHLHIELAKLQLHINLQQWHAAETAWLHAWTDIEQLPPNRNTIYDYINLGRQLMVLLPPQEPLLDQIGLPMDSVEESAEPVGPDQGWLNDTVNWGTGEALLRQALVLAQGLGDQRAKAYAMGYLGYIAERLQDWDVAKSRTYQALALAESVQAEEIMYQWQWQLGRILLAQGDRQGAIAAYSAAVRYLRDLRTDLLATATEGQFRFQEGVEPIYRELVDLLLTAPSNGLVPQANLVQARDVMESFQVAELGDFFQDACLQNELVPIEAVDPEAAVIYPIILRDRLDIIVSLPQYPLQYFSTPIAQADLTHLINDFRNNLVIRSRFDFRAQARQLYDWLLRPAADLLSQHPIKTLVFVLDGPLRQIPMAVLNDGDRYLIEQYQVVVAPGLTLVNAQPPYHQSPRALIAGLSQSRHGFSALAYVDEELQQISDTISGSVLLNEQFTSEAIQQKLASQPFSLVHIASHGQFSSRPEETFIIAWDKHLDIDALRHILRAGQRSGQAPIDLLVLSACETATGDPMAPLGLAGMAVKAGAKSTLATQWSVNDQVTTQFMQQFYQHLAAGMSKAESLRQSQLWLLHFERFSHPLYWAPYVLIGDWN